MDMWSIITSSYLVIKLKTLHCDCCTDEILADDNKRTSIGEMEAREEAQAKPLFLVTRCLIVFTRSRESFWQRHRLECVGHKRRSNAAGLVEEHLGVV
jgi:hypothetical protein